MSLWLPVAELVLVGLAVGLAGALASAHRGG
jgi:hypothetical protein